MDNLEKIQLGVIYINKDEKSLIDNEEDLFNSIPQRTNCRTYILDEETRKRKEDVQKKIEEFHKELEKKNDIVSQEQL
jgi:predicted secreted protein